MTNPNGHGENLLAAHPGNTSAVRHGTFSRTGRVLAPLAQEIAVVFGPKPNRPTSGGEEVGLLGFKFCVSEDPTVRQSSQSV
jgi:hypothetical protein